MSRYHGKAGRVMLATTGTGTAVTVQFSGWTLNRATDRVDVTSFGDGNKVYVQGLPDLQGTISGFWDDANDQLFEASESADGGKLYLYPSVNAISKYWYGPAWLDASIETTAAGAVTVSGTFAAAGSWGRK